MPSTRRIYTNLSKGELSGLLECRADVAAYFEGAKQLENWVVLRQGGVRRRAGTRFMWEVKTSSLDTILLPFEFSVDDAYILEVGNLYVRFGKNKARIPISAAGAPVEVVTPYPTADLRELHFTQSADVLFLFHVEHAQRRLSRVSDTSWSLSTSTFVPPPSFEADFDYGTGASAGANITIGLGANTGNAIKFHTSADVFLAADAGRQIIAGSGRAVITTVSSAREVIVNILDAFDATITAGPNTLSSGSAGSVIMTSVAHGAAVGNYVVLTSGGDAGAIRRIVSVGGVDTFTIDAVWPNNQAGVTWNKVLAKQPGPDGTGWRLRLSPQTTLDPDIKEPVGAQITFVTAAAAFRAADVGLFVHVYGGVAEITIVDSTTQVRALLYSVLAEATNANPAAAPAGAWSLEVPSWSTARGFPRTGEFFQGRLYQASTLAQPTTFWGSRADDFDNYAVGIAADDAVEFTLASRKVNRLEWLADNVALFLGSTGSEHRATGGSPEAPIGGDVIPLVDRLDTIGSAPVQPIVLGRRIVFLDRARQRLYSIGFDLEEDGFLAREITVLSEHILGNGAKLGHLAFARRPDPRLYLVNEAGELVCLTFFPQERVVGFSRFTTDGTFESVAVIPDANRGPDQVWVIVKRTINGATKRYVELVEEHHANLESLYDGQRVQMMTDCGVVQVAASATATVTGLTHLEAKTVDVLVNGSYKGTKVVASGSITLDTALAVNDVVEVGIPYDSTLVTMRPGIPGVVIEGLPRSWNSLFARLKDTIGGTINGQAIQYQASDLDEIGLFTGDRKVLTEGTDTEGRVTVVQDQPYPMTVLGLFGTLQVGDYD